MEPVAAGDHVALELLVTSVVPIADQRPLRVEVVYRDLGRLEMQWLAGVETKADQVLDDLGLTVDDDRPPPARSLSGIR